MLKSLSDLDYAIEWRVINAAEYGMPQRRKRVFLVGTHKSSSLYAKYSTDNAEEILLKKGILATGFPVEKNILEFANVSLPKSILKVSESFNLGEKLSPFLNSGVCFKGEITTLKTSPDYSGSFSLLEGVLQNEEVSKLERLNMFPDNHTQLEGISDAKRAFFMGNALVVGVVEKIANALIKNIKA